MASIYTEIEIEAPPEQGWAALRDVGAVHWRLMPGFVSDTQLDGHTRILSLPNGGMVREVIVALDDDHRRFAYAVVEGRMLLEHHHASFQVFADGEGGSRLVWITDALPDERAPDIRARVDRGAEVMKQTIEAAARRD